MLRRKQKRRANQCSQLSAFLFGMRQSLFFLYRVFYTLVCRSIGKSIQEGKSDDWQTTEDLGGRQR